MNYVTETTAGRPVTTRVTGGPDRERVTSLGRRPRSAGPGAAGWREEGGGGGIDPCGRLRLHMVHISQLTDTVAAGEASR